MVKSKKSTKSLHPNTYMYSVHILCIRHQLIVLVITSVKFFPCFNPDPISILSTLGIITPRGGGTKRSKAALAKLQHGTGWDSLNIITSYNVRMSHLYNVSKLLS